MDTQPGACFSKAMHPAGAQNKSLISNTADGKKLNTNDYECLVLANLKFIVNCSVSDRSNEQSGHYNRV